MSTKNPTTTEGAKKENPVLAYNSHNNDFAVVSAGLASAMISMGNPHGFNRVASRLKPRRLVLRWIASGKTAVDIELIGMTLTHVCGRVEAKKILAQLVQWTGAPAFNVKDSGRVVSMS